MKKFNDFQKSTRRVLAVAGREFASSAASPAAWVFLIIFLVLAAFWSFVGGGLFSSGQADLTPFFDRMPWLFLVIVPALAMPMWSEERRVGVFELSLSFPSSIFELVLGKYLAGLLLLGIALLLTCGIPATAFVLGEPDRGAVFSGYLGAWLLGSVYLAVSSFCSALSRSQTASFLLSVFVCGIFLFIGWPQVTELLSAKLPESAVMFLASCAFLPNYQAFQKGLIDSGEVVYTLSLSALFLAFTCAVLDFAAAGTGSLIAPGVFRDRAARRAVRSLLMKCFGWALFVLALNITGAEYKFRLDASSDRAYSISKGAAMLAKSLEAPVTLRFYASFSSPGMPEGLRKYAERVKWLLGEFAGASKGKIALEIIDPVQDSPDEEAALMDGIQTLEINSGERMFLGLSAARADTVSTVGFLSPAQENLLEYEIARAVVNVSREKRPKIGILSPFRILGSMRDNTSLHRVSQDKARQEPPWFVALELAKDFELEMLPLHLREIPKGIDALMIVHPVDFPRMTLYAVDRYLAHGGRACVFLDPQSLYARMKMRTDFSMANKTESSMEMLTSAWGVSFRPDVMAADMVCAYRRTMPDRLVTNPLALVLTPAQISRGNPRFAGLNSLSLYYAGVLMTEPVPGLKYETVLHTSKNSSIVPVAGASRENVIRDFQASGKELPLAIRIEGKLPTAFPDGAPDSAAAGKSVKKTPIGKETEIFLFADSDMIFNDLCMSSGTDSFGRRTYLRSNDNVTMVQNVMEKLTGSDKLSGVRNRLPMSRPLTKVNEIKAAAELRYRNRILELERELRESRMRLNDLERLETSQGAAGRFSGEKNDEIRSIQLRLASASREIKHLRGELRNDLNKLDNIIRFVNLILIPFLVALTGILWSVIRLSKGRKH